MIGVNGQFLKAVGLGTVSYVVLAAGAIDSGFAQTALPPIQIEAPAARPSTARATRPSTARIARRAARPSSPQSPVPLNPTPAPARESASGPVDGVVAQQSATGTKTDTRILETPQSMSVVTRAQIDQQGATTVTDSLRYTAGVFVGGPGVQSRRFDGFMVRGLDGPGLGSSMGNYIDGLRWYYGARQATQIDPWMVERVEVFKGPASIMYGGGSPGGMLNLVTKRPSATASNEVFVRAGSYGYLEGGFDSTGPLGNDPRFLYRIIGLGRVGDSQIDFQKEQRTLIAPSFTFAPTSDTKLTLQATYQDDPKTLDSGFLPAKGAVLPNPNGQLPINRWQGDPQWGPFFERKQKSIGYLFEHRFDETFTFRSNFRYGNLSVNFPAVDNVGLQANDRLLNRAVNWFVTDSDSFTADNHLQAKFATGPVTHTALFGVDYGRMDLKFLLSQPGGLGSITPLDLYAPVYNSPSFVAPRLTNDRNDKLAQTGVYAQDQLAFGNFRLMLSGRKDFADISSRTTFLPTNTISSNTASDPEAFTKRAGLLYLFDNGLAPYVAYSTSFEPQAGADIIGKPFVPTTGEQYEAGLKYEPRGLNALLTVSVFDLTKQNVPTTDPSNINFLIQTGEIRSRGVEFEGKTRLWQGLDLIATYTYNDVRVTKSNATTTLLDGSIVATQDKVPVRTPAHMASLWAYYKHTFGPVAGLGFGAGVRYVGETYGTDSNVWNLTGFITTPSTVPAYALVDAVINYDFGYANPGWKGFSASVNARNLFDKVYVAGCFLNTNCSYGEARTVLGTLRYRW